MNKTLKHCIEQTKGNWQIDLNLNNLMTNRLLTIVRIGKVRLGQGEHFTLVIRYIYLLVIKLFKFRSIGF